MRSIIKSILALCIIAVIAIAGGCGNKETAQNAGPSQPTSSQTAKKTIKISMIGKSSTNPVFLSARTGAEAAAKDLSAKYDINIIIDWRTPEKEDGQVQAQRIAQAVNEGADAILISCSDAGKVTRAINDAVDRNVPVMTFDSDAPQSKRFAFYGVDDIETGRLVMQYLAKVMNEKGKVAILAGNQNAPNLKKRVDGVKLEAKKYPGIQIIGVFNHPETPQKAAEEVIKVNNAYPDINGWAMIGGWPLFTKALLTEIDPAKMKVVAVDALPAQLEYVAKGIVPVLLAQPTYKWGYVGVQTIIDKIYLNKEVPEINKMELVPVSKDNLSNWAKQLKEWGFTDKELDRYIK